MNPVEASVTIPSKAITGRTRSHRRNRKRNGFPYTSGWVVTFLMIILQPCCGTTVGIGKTFNMIRTDSHEASTGEIHPDALGVQQRANGRVLQAPEEQTDDASNYGGSDECPCIDSSTVLSTMSECVTDAGLQGAETSGGCYPLHFGATTCSMYDMTYNSLCMAGGSANSTTGIPSYCYDQWCYVDFNKCKLSDEFVYRSYFDTTEDLFYSYSTCNDSANGWLDYQTRSSTEQVTFQVTIPRMRFPDHFKYTEEGEIATDSSYYYNDSIPWAGSIIDYLNAVAEISNMNGIQFTSRSHGADRAQPQSSYTASVHDVSAGLSNAGGGTFWITSQRLSMTTFSTPFAVDRIHLIVKQPEAQKSTVRENAEKIMMPFTLGLWILLVSVVLITAILIVYLDREEGDDGIWSDKTSGIYWRKSSPQRRLGLVLKAFLDSFIIHSAHMLGHAVEFDPMTSMAQKILYFGFAVVIFIAVAAYTANLAAFLTLSGSVSYVSNMEEAIAANTPICVNPVLDEEYNAAWPGANFVYNRTAEASGFESLMAMMDMYDSGVCSAIGYQFETSVLANQEIMNEFCKRNLVSTGSYVLEKPLAFPVQNDMAAGLSYWLYEAEKQSITYNFFAEKRLPARLCSLSVSTVTPDADALLSLQPSSMILPLLVWICCIAAALVLNALRTRQKNYRYLKRSNRNCADSKSDIEHERPGGSPQASYASHPNLRYRRASNISPNVYPSEFSDVLQQRHAEVMRMLSEIASDHETADSETVPPVECIKLTETHGEAISEEGHKQTTGDGGLEKCDVGEV